MSSEEFTEWMAYDQIDPIGNYRSDWQNSRIVATLLNIYRKKGAAPLKIEDVMPDWLGVEKEQEQTPEEMWNVVYMMHIMLGGKPLDESEKPKFDGYD